MICDGCSARPICESIKNNGQRIKACHRYEGLVRIGGDDIEKPNRITTGFIMGDSGTAESRGGKE